MNEQVQSLSNNARKAAQVMDWATVSTCARRIMELDGNNPEGHFLFGLSEKAQGRPAVAVQAFSHALTLRSTRPQEFSTWYGMWQPLRAPG